MSTKLLLAAVPLFFLASAVMAEDIVYDNDWRAGETGYIHHRHECGWHRHHGRRTVSGVTYYDSDFQPSVTYDSAPAETVYDTEYVPADRYDRDFDRRGEFRDERFRDRDAGVGAGVRVGGDEGVSAGAGVSNDGAGAGVHVGGHGVGVGVGGDEGVGVHVR